MIRSSPARRPVTITAAIWLLSGIAGAMIIFVAGVVYDLAHYRDWAHTVGARLQLPMSQIASDISSNTHFDIGVIIVFVITAGLFLRGALQISRRSWPTVAYVLMFVFAISLIGAGFSGSESSMSRLDQAISSFEPAWDDVGPTIALEVAALASLTGLILAVLPSSRRWYGPPIMVSIRKSLRAQEAEGHHTPTDAHMGAACASVRVTRAEPDHDDQLDAI